MLAAPAVLVFWKNRLTLFVIAALPPLTTMPAPANAKF
jgi:hypothetical protein